MSRPARQPVSLAVPLAGHIARRRAGLRGGGFTLTEVLIVIGIIILLVVIAIPAFSIFRGERSIEAAENQLSAMVARARTEAIGYQKAGGVLFFRDVKTPDRVSVAQVWETEVPASGWAEVYLDLVPDRDFLVLPMGVGVQVVDDCELLNGARQDDAYINFNRECYFGPGSGSGTNVSATTEIGGVVLFDYNGRLMSVQYGFRIREPANSPNSGLPTRLGDLLFNNQTPGVVPAGFPASDWLHPGNTATTSVGVRKAPIRSQFALVAYDRVAFNNAFPNANARERDPQMLGQNERSGQAYSGTGEKAEEDWLDKNAVPLLVNRFNGTIERGP